MRRNHALILVTAMVLYLGAGSSPALRGQPTRELTGALLDHGERALRFDDFQAAVPEELPKGEPPDELPIMAYSHTVVSYRFEAQTSKVRGKYRAQLKQITFTAVFDRTKSWNALPEDRRLLEHHQGHFDLARIGAYQAEADITERMRRDRAAFQAESATAQGALDELDKKIAHACRALEEEFKREHEYFDVRTRYGTLEDLEREERAKQQERLRKHAADRAPPRPGR